MNAPNDSSDPLLQSLAEEASDLPARAAAAARERTTQRRHNRLRLTLAGAVSLVGVVGFILVSPRGESPTIAVKPVPNESALKSASSFPTTELDETASHARAELQLFEMPIPTGLNKEQFEFVKAANDMPLLLVRDASGKVTRIHAIER